MEIPAHLHDTFRTLDNHGHLLKTKYGSELRRHIRFNDENLSLHLEVRKKNGDRWERIYPEQAACERKERERREKKKKKKNDEHIQL